MSGAFKRSWSTRGSKIYNTKSPSEDFNRNISIFRSGRLGKSNVQQRLDFGTQKPQTSAISDFNQDFIMEEQDENELPFYLKPQPGMRIRSLTETNIRSFEVNGVTRSHNEIQAPKSKFATKSFKQIPEKIAPILTNISNTVSQACPKTDKFFQSGGMRVQKALDGVRTSINSFSQKFKKATLRRYKLDETPNCTPTRKTPSRTSKVTPGRLYSPFNVNTPRTPHSYMRGPKRLQNGLSRRSTLNGYDNPALIRTPQGPQNFQSNNNNWAKFNSPNTQLLSRLSQGLGPSDAQFQSRVSHGPGPSNHYFLRSSFNNGHFVQPPPQFMF